VLLAGQCPGVAGLIMTPTTAPTIVNLTKTKVTRSEAGTGGSVTSAGCGDGVWSPRDLDQLGRVDDRLFEVDELGLADAELVHLFHVRLKFWRHLLRSTTSAPWPRHTGSAGARPARRPPGSPAGRMGTRRDLLADRHIDPDRATSWSPAEWCTSSPVTCRCPRG